MLGTELLREVGRRLLLLEETLAAGGTAPGSVVLCFEQQRLHLRFVSGGVFGVLAQHDVNTASLKMALTISCRRMRESASGGVSFAERASSA